MGMSAGYATASSFGTYEENLQRVVDNLRGASKVMVLSGAGMSTAAGIPDFRSPDGLYGSSKELLDRFTYIGDDRERARQREELSYDVKAALTLDFFRRNPLPYHEMRRGMILGLGKNQWKLSIGHVFPQILAANNKLQLLASQNIDGLDHKVVEDKGKLYNPHGLMSALVSEPLGPGQPGGEADITLCMETSNPIYQKYVDLVASNIRDIYEDRPLRKGKSSHLWRGPKESTPITLEMFGDLLPERFQTARKIECDRREYSVKPGSVMFDRTLWSRNAKHEPCDAFREVSTCDLVLVMGTSLSGLTIDNVAHGARCPRVVFDMTTTPAASISRRGEWRRNDSLLQKPIDESIIDALVQMNWLGQLLEDRYLQHLCLKSLETLKGFAEIHADLVTKEQRDKIATYIAKEIEREQSFYHGE